MAGGDLSVEKEGDVQFRVKIISPLKAAEEDLARRQRRYAEHAREETTVRVINLDEGPPALNSSGDILESANAIFRQGAGTTAEAYDAILIDCVFDPAVKELQEQTGLPTFGPTRTTLPLIPMVAETFSIVARTERQCELLAETVEGYGYGGMIRSLRALGITYEEAKKADVFKAVMAERLNQVVREDGAGSVMFGSTTMSLDQDLVEAAGGRPLFMPGMVALRVMEQLWHDGLWPAQSLL